MKRPAHRMIGLWVISFLYSIVNGNQYIDLPFSIDYLNVSALSFNRSWIINYVDTLMEMVTLPVFNDFLFHL